MDDLLYYILVCSQKELSRYIERHLKYYNYNNITKGKKFIYATGDIPILLVAHMDTVHYCMPTQIFHDKEQNTIWSPQGIGGDDRAGIYAILKIIENYKPHVLFLEDEEKGGIGAKYATGYMDIPDVNFMIEIDRHGSDDAVFYDCGNIEFKDYILSYGFQENYGTFSDISVLSPAWDIASVNLSIGYYNEHSLAEYVKLDDLENTISLIKDILENKQDIFYDFQEDKYFNYPFNELDFDDFYNEINEKSF